jgi:histone H3/H4
MLESDKSSAKQCIQKVTTDFIIMVTFDMARKCKREGRKTLSTEDLFQSLKFLGNAVSKHCFYAAFRTIFVH